MRTPTFKRLPWGIVSLLFLLTAAAAWSQNPVPVINQPLVPQTVVPGGSGFTLVVNGTGFVLPEWPIGTGAP